jgi:hypothetical protein
MAEHPELWTEGTPEQRYLFDHQPAFGLAHEAERMRQGEPPAPRRSKARRRRRDLGPTWTYFRMPWSYGDRSAGDVWHRLRCRRGHHEMGGGHSMQLGSTVVYVERRCRWCGATPL